MLRDTSGLALLIVSSQGLPVLSQRKEGLKPCQRMSRHHIEPRCGWCGGAGRKRPDSADCRNVLFLCPDNSAMSIIAEAILSRWEGKRFRAFSAGTRRALEVHHLAADLLRANRIWRPGFRPKDCAEFLNQDAPRMDFVIGLAIRRRTGCPPLGQETHGSFTGA